MLWIKYKDHNPVNLDKCFSFDIINIQDPTNYFTKSPKIYYSIIFCSSSEISNNDKYTSWIFRTEKERDSVYQYILNELRLRKLIREIPEDEICQ